MFSKLFGIKYPKTPPRETQPRDVAALTQGLTLPAVQLVKTDHLSKTWIGGEPQLSDELVWPTIKGKPLTFLAKIELAELQSVLEISWLPQTGSLLFFYDVENQPWGFDPKDRGSWSVLYSQKSLVQQKNPDATSGFSEFVAPYSNMIFKLIETYPSYERAQIESLQLSDDESDILADIQDSQFQDQPKHQISGYPSPVQGDGMELECQLVSNGIYCGNSKGYESPRAVELSSSSGDWKLLLQFDSDDELMWGDCGTLYFWVREQDAKAGDFNNVWMVLQCG